eukprot:TRINITY_DN10094_c0_g1_i6.p2 TRINITY_DN10094_c0_g1~~TRINITY_DN10094_c0_g1_i6.p2  ORF type:complete len:148 (-),score=26.43 TRINITY_DN10094_c0_g1_i6:625-1068(-)
MEAVVSTQSTGVRTQFKLVPIRLLLVFSGPSNNKLSEGGSCSSPLCSTQLNIGFGVTFGTLVILGTVVLGPLFGMHSKIDQVSVLSSSQIALLEGGWFMLLLLVFIIYCFAVFSCTRKNVCCINLLDQEDEQLFGNPKYSFIPSLLL